MDDPGPTSLIVSIVCLVLIIAIEEFIYMCRAALLALPDARADEMVKSEKKSVKRLISHKDGVFLSMSFGSIFLTLIFATISEVAFGTRLTRAFVNDGMSLTGAEVLGGFIICLVAALLLMSIAGIMPRRIGRKRPVHVLKRFAAPALVLYTINIPAVKIANGISIVLMKLTGLDRLKEEDNVTEAEILSMVDAGEETGTIENDQSEYIKNIFEFDDVYVSDLMTHRTEVTAVEKKASLRELNQIAQEEGYSRIPVYEDDIDNIVGVAYIKDLLPYVGKELTTRVTVGEIMHEALYVPETMRCDKLFKQMNDKRVQMAIAVDEYGGTAGIITMEDLLESIFGNIQDEYDDEEEEEIQKTGDGSWLIDGAVDIEDVGEKLGIQIPEDDDYDTIGGFLISQLGFIPEDGTEAETTFGGYNWKVMDVDDRRIGKVRAVKQKDSLKNS